jgi:hypothetical protein
MPNWPTQTPAELGNLLTAASILLATAGWIYSAWLQRRLAMRSHTLEIVLALDTNEQLRTLDRADAEIGPGSSPAAAMTSDFRQTLNFYDTISAAVRLKTLDPSLIIRALRPRMLRFYEHAKLQIERARESHHNPRYAEDLEWFVKTKLKYNEWKKNGAQLARIETVAAKSGAGIP